MPKAIELLLDDARGIYIPRDFVTEFDLTKFEGISAADVETCRNPDNEWYWDAWSNITDNATFTENGNVWHLYQDGDLFLICYELMTAKEKENFGFEVDYE